MKKCYATPKAEKIEFNYTDVVVASGGSHGDNGNGNGCNRSSVVMVAKNGGSRNKNSNGCC